MSPDALPQPPAPSDEEREDAACAWADHRKHYGASTDPELLSRDHRTYLAGYYDGRRDQRNADVLAELDKHQGTEPVNIDAAGRLAAMDALKLYREQHPGVFTPAEGVTWEAGYRAAMRAEHEPPRALGMLGHWLDYWGTAPNAGDERVAFAQGFQWRQQERFTTTTEQESTTMPDTTEPATWTPHPLPDGHPAETPAEFVRRAIGEALGAASTAWENNSGAGTFDSTKASAIADGLTAVVEDYANQRAAEPAEALVGELAYLPGAEPLPVVAIRAAVELASVKPYGIVLSGPTSETVTQTADKLLGWLRRETGEETPNPGPEQPERPSMEEAIAAELERTPATVADQLKRDLAGWTLTPTEADRMHETITRRTVHGRQAAALRVPFDELPDGAYIAHGAPLTQAPHVFTLYRGTWLSTVRAKSEKARRDAYAAHQEHGLVPLRTR